MDIMGNWEKLLVRAGEEDKELKARLLDIQARALEELSESGSLLAISGEKVRDIAKRKNPQERYILTGDVGRYLADFKPGEGLGNYDIDISSADAFSGCIAIAIAAIVENFNGRVKRMKVNCIYKTKHEDNDRMGSYISEIFGCYPFATLEVTKTLYGNPKKKGILAKLFG